MNSPLHLSHLIGAGAAVAGGVVLGLLVYRFVLKPIVLHTSLTQAGVDGVVLGAIREASVVWFTVAGAYAARLILPLSPGPARGVDRGLLAIVIVSGTFVLARIVGDALKLYTLRNAGVLPASSIFVNVSRLIIFIIGALVLLQTFGVSITPLLTALGVGGLAVALAMQDTLANLFAGLQLLATKKVRIGDFVRLDTGEEGEIVDINWRNTSLRQLPNNLVIVPNARLAQAVVTNFNMPQNDMAVLVELGVAYGSDLDKVERVTIDVARECLSAVPGGVSRFEPFIRYHTFAASSIQFSVILRAESFVDQYLLKHEFVKRLSARYAKEKITIPFPQRTVRLANPIPDGAKPAARRRAKT